MHYLFLDESHFDQHDRREIVVASWAVEQRRLNSGGEWLAALFKTPIEEQICSALKGLDALALVASAALEKSLFRSGEIDSTDDIPQMARVDNVWSQCVVFAVGKLILQHLLDGRCMDAIDVYYDPKSLKREHAEALNNTLRGLVVSEAKRFEVQLGRNRLRKLKIRRIEQVAKPIVGQVHNKFQLGTWVADKLCSRGSQMCAQASGRIRIYDMSDKIRRTVQQWEGKSYFDE